MGLNQVTYTLYCYGKKSSECFELGPDNFQMEGKIKVNESVTNLIIL